MRSYARILSVFLFALMAVSIWQVANLATGVVAGSKQPLTIAQAAPSGAYFDHVIIILMENQGVYDICRSSPPPCSISGPAPYMAGLANTYGIGSQYLSIINTSQPNYIALIGGSTLGCTSSGCPTITAPNLVDRFEATGLTWKGYFENQNVASGCDASSHEPYEPIHNPFISFQDISTNTARCNSLVLANPSTCGSVTDCVLINDLNSPSAPNFIWLTPNDCNDMRGASGICSASITTGDNYLKSLVPNILSSSTFKTGRSALFITFDEGNGYCPLNGSSESCVYSVWAGPAAKTSFGTTNLYNHYSFPKTIETNWNLASLSTGDGSATPMTEFFNPTSPSSDFGMSASPTSLRFNAGSSATSTITLTSLNNFAGTVALSATSSPSGLSVSMSSTSVSLSAGGTGTSTLSVSSSNPGTYTVTITGTSGSLSHQTTVAVTINSVSQGDFSISANPSSLNVNAGSSSTSTITLTSLNGFAGSVILFATSSPSGLSLSLGPSSVSLSSGGTSTSTLSISGSTAGSYTITITGSSGSLSHQTIVTVTVNAVNTGDFSITASPSSLSISAGSSSTSKIALTSLNSFAGTVTLSASGSPTGLGLSLSPTSVSLSGGGTGTSTLSVSSSSPGSYTVTVTGTGGSLSHQTTVTVTINPVNSGDFSITASPSSLTVSKGSSAGSTITLTSLSGFSGTITLSVTVSSNSGPRTSLSSSSVTLTSGGQGTSILTLKATHKTQIGSYTITVTGTSGSISHTVKITVNVT
jgi:uncharacterized membrane protein